MSDLFELFDVEDALHEFARTDLCGASLSLLKAMGFPIKKNNDTKCELIEHFVYFCTEQKVHYNSQEMAYLKNVEKISILGKINQSDIDGQNENEKDTSHITFITAELNSSKLNRSEDAHYLSKILNKAFYGPILLLFKNENSIMLSTYREDIDLVCLSEWLDIECTDCDYLISFMPAFFSYNQGKTIREFHNELSFAIARKYIKWPESYEYASFECFPCKEFLEEDKIINWKLITEFGETSRNYYLDIYGDDYVCNDTNFCLLEEKDFDLTLFGIDDFDLSDDKFEENQEDDGFDENQDVEQIRLPMNDLARIEIAKCELPLMKNNILIEKDRATMDYSILHKKDEDTNRDSILNEIDEETLKDPIKLLEWITNREEESNNSIKNGTRERSYCENNMKRLTNSEMDELPNYFSERFEEHKRKNAANNINSACENPIIGETMHKDEGESRDIKEHKNTTDLPYFVRKRLGEHDKEAVTKEKICASARDIVGGNIRKIEAAKPDSNGINEIDKLSDFMKIRFEDHKRKAINKEQYIANDRTVEEAKYKRTKEEGTTSEPLFFANIWPDEQAQKIEDSSKEKNDATVRGSVEGSLREVEETKLESSNKFDHIEHSYFVKKQLATTGSSELDTSTETIFERAAGFLKLKKWNEASELYTKIIQQNSTEYRGWWGLFLMKTHMMQLKNNKRQFIDTSDALAAINVAPSNAKFHLETIFDKYIQSNPKVYKLTFRNTPVSVTGKQEEMYVQLNDDETFLFLRGEITYAITEGLHTIKFNIPSHSMTTTITFEMNNDVTLTTKIRLFPAVSKRIWIEAQGAKIIKQMIT